MKYYVDVKIGLTPTWRLELESDEVDPDDLEQHMMDQVWDHIGNRLSLTITPVEEQDG